MDFKFSIIIPVHYETDVLRKCLTSIFNQTYKNFEVICVLDNASEQVEQSLEGFPVLYTKCNYNCPGLTRNLGFYYAQGDYVWFIDADDAIPFNTVLEEINCALQDQPDELVGDNNTGWLPIGLDVVVGNRVGKTSFLREHQISFSNACSGEDSDFIKLAHSYPINTKYVHNDQPYYAYTYQHPGSLTWLRDYRHAIWFVFSGCGKTYVAHHNIHWVDVEANSFKLTESYYAMAHFLLEQAMGNSFGVLANCQDEVMDLFTAGNIPLNIIMPSPEMKNEILERVRLRDGDQSGGYKQLSEHYDEIYNSIVNRPNTNIIYLKPGEYVNDYIPQLEALNTYLFSRKSGL